MIGEEESNGREEKEKIVVSVRLRPLNDKEVATNDGCDWECIGDHTIAIDTTTLPNAYYTFGIYYKKIKLKFFSDHNYHDSNKTSGFMCV